MLWGFQLWWVRPLVLLVSSRGLPNLLVPFPGVLPAGGLGVVVDVVAVVEQITIYTIVTCYSSYYLPVLASNFMSQPGGRGLLPSAIVRCYVWCSDLKQCL